MSEVRVFELAKELKMPAKQLLSKMRKAGIPVTGNFSEMTVEQAEIVRDMAKSATGIVVPESVKRTPNRQKISSENTAAETDLPEKSKKVKASKIVTISTKSKSDEEEVEEAPKRRVRRKRTDSPPSIKEADSESKTSSKVLLLTAVCMVIIMVFSPLSYRFGWVPLIPSLGSLMVAVLGSALVWLAGLILVLQRCVKSEPRIVSFCFSLWWWQLYPSSL